jgi:hypothetical protein
MSAVHWWASADDAIREIVEFLGPDADYSDGQTVFSEAHKVGAIYVGTIPGAAQLSGYRYTDTFSPMDYLPRSFGER